ncbi:MAG: CHAD domain-containing protein [Atopobiaceae bacterium]|jgi:CHAD domain-containing protein/phosphohistidine phosphatase SixA|nr:CHAD domain-containing protein [Atopobiaceae bacterium]
MKTLIVMRHGEAMPPEQGQHDADRSLTEAGIMALEARLPHMIRLLETEGSNVQIWTSPAKRAHQTAKLLERALKDSHVPLEKRIEAHSCLWEQDIDEFLADLHVSQAECIFAVGHIPFAEDIVDELTGSTPSFAPGAFGCLEVHLAHADEGDAISKRDSARLQWFVQGPDPMPWKTLAQLQNAIANTAAAIEDRREAFFADPKDIETIHRFRTNTRTLRSLIAFIAPWQDAKENAKIQEILKDIVGHTSRLRELDVFEKQARSNPDSSPELLAFCKKQASDERAKVLKALGSKRVRKAFETAMALSKDISWRKRYIDHGLPESTIRSRFDAMIESVGHELDDLRLSDDEQTHDVRKRAKRARYIAEFNADILGEDAVEIAESMTAHQDSLGDVCDARANIRLINEFLQRDLPEPLVWELTLMRAQNETLLFSTLKANEA